MRTGLFRTLLAAALVVTGPVALDRPADAAEPGEVVMPTEFGTRLSGVQVMAGGPSRDAVGKTVKYGTAETWLTGTTLTSTTYKGSKVPFALKANRYYRFTVTATDAAGNTRSAPAKTVKVPKERSSPGSYRRDLLHCGWRAALIHRLETAARHPKSRRRQPEGG